jgi:hypothetical protein
MTAGSLPNGLTLSAAGVVAGTPTNPGSHTFTAQVTSGSQIAAQVLTIRIQN